MMGRKLQDIIATMYFQRQGTDGRMRYEDMLQLVMYTFVEVIELAEHIRVSQTAHK